MQSSGGITRSELSDSSQVPVARPFQSSDVVTSQTKDTLPACSGLIHYDVLLVQSNSNLQTPNQKATWSQ